MSLLPTCSSRITWWKRRARSEIPFAHRVPRSQEVCASSCSNYSLSHPLISPHSSCLTSSLSSLFSVLSTRNCTPLCCRTSISRSIRVANKRCSHNLPFLGRKCRRGRPILLDPTALVRPRGRTMVDPHILKRGILETLIGTHTTGIGRGLIMIGKEVGTTTEEEVAVAVPNMMTVGPSVTWNY